MLFELDALHTGSLVVAKFNTIDKIDDWPLIDAGYDLACGNVDSTDFLSNKRVD